MQNISTALDLPQERERLEAVLDPLAVTCAYLVAGGSSKRAALIEVVGFHSGQAWAKVYTEDTDLLIAILKQHNAKQLAAKLGMDKDARLEHHQAMLLEHAHAYRQSGEAAHGALYWKAAATINSMTGDNAPTEVRHRVEITHTQLNNMSESERTEAYKRMMTGKLHLIEDEGHGDSGHSLIEGECVTVEDGGDTLGPGRES